MSFIREFYNKKIFPSNFVMSLKYRLVNEKPNLKIMDPIESIDYILRKGCSIARFGDGEFELILWPDGSEGYQKNSVELATNLKRVLGSDNKNLLVCIPYALNDISGRTQESRNFWYYWCERKQQRKRIVDLIRQYHGNSYVFGDTQISRPYIAWPNAKNADKVFPKLKELWENRDIIIVEGVKTRLGVGNDLLANAKSIKRILGPATNAFERRAEIRKAIIDVHTNELVIMALGPTATILALDLAEKGIQALDIGHVDIEYEWYLRKSIGHDLIPGKYTNEAVSGSEVDECLDDDYLKQIVAKVE